MKWYLQWIKSDNNSMTEAKFQSCFTICSKFGNDYNAKCFGTKQKVQRHLNLWFTLSFKRN